MTARATLIAAAAALGLAAGAPVAPATAAPPEGERAGRFVMQPVDDGFLRMDSETGAMSMCMRKAGAFACEAIPDDRGAAKEPAAKEQERLAAENQLLRAEIKRLEEMLGLGDKPGGERQARRGPKFELPSEEDVDKAIGYIERMVKKFRDRMKDFEGGSRGTPL